MADQVFDAYAWLRRIGHHGPVTPTLATLRAIVAAQASTIPFENIDVLLGQPPKLDIGSLQEKLIARGRGGYCFEQNAVLRAGLQALGFDVTSLTARVIRSRPVDAATPAAHMVLTVDLPQGEYLADVGFGGLTPTAPLAMRPHVEQATPHETMRFVPAGEDMVLEAKLGDGWEHLYRIMPRPVPDIDYEVANWMTATHPGSPFVGHLIAARPGPDGTRNTFYNGRLSVRRRSGLAERRMIESVEDLRTVIAETFRLALPKATVAAMHDALDRAGNRGTTSPFFA